MNPAIQIENLSKCFRIGATPTGGLNLTERLGTIATSTWQKLKQLANPDAVAANEGYWALKDVSFDVAPGEVVGVIGRNGAGKSTLLKLLSRISAPTSGRIGIRGRMGSLLEVGTGFHPELTGRENVYLNGSILGMTRREIAAKFDKIVEFAEIGQFLDTPVKRYSSGMYVRLAFSVAAHLEPEILIVDEVLAVGDATFQRRCIDRMTQLAQQGRTILFVSHNMQLIPRLCQRAVLLDRGQVVTVGESSAVTQLYLDRLLTDTRAGDLRDKPRTGDGRARFIRGYLVDPDGRPVNQFLSGDDLIVRMEIESTKPLQDVALAVVVQSLYGMRVITSWTREVGVTVTIKPGIQTYECRFEKVRLRPGHTALIDLWMADGNTIDSVERALVVDVSGDERHAHLTTTGDQGVIVCDYSWRPIPDAGSGS